MAFATVSDPLVAAALWIGAGALALSAALVAAILLLRLRLIVRLAHEARFSAAWQPLLAACVNGVPRELPPLDEVNGVLFLRLWVHAQEWLRGESQRHLVEFAVRVGADRLAVRFLGSNEPRKELLALVALGHLRFPGTLPLAEALIDVESPVISLTAAQALLRIDAVRELPRVVDVAARRADWPIAKIAAMLAECGPDLASSALCAAIDAQYGQRPAGPALARLLRLLRTASAEIVRPVVLRVFEGDESPEAVAAALDVLWHPDDARLARAAASHAQWFVRVAAAKALGRIGTAGDAGLLLGMLSDQSWWVRYRSAQALARLPGMTSAELARMRDSAGDRYAGDMLAQVVSEMGAS